MYELHQWYMDITKISNRESLMVNVKKDHYYHEKAVSVEYSELFSYTIKMHLTNLLSVAIVCK